MSAEEILNIEYHRIRLTVKSLNKFPTKIAAAKALGIAERTMYRDINRFNIHENKPGQYAVKEVKPVKK